jgi:hypothetical protein
MIGADRQQGAQDPGEEQAVTTPGKDPANSPTNIGPNLPRQVERSIEDADTGPREAGADSASQE